MFNCEKDVLAYQNDKVSLPRSEQTRMRDRRNANRDRLKKGLRNKNEPQPREFCKQGSYAMKTMVRDTDNQYDIDDGVYFEKNVLKGPNGGEKSALDARTMVRDAVDDGSFKTPPEVRPNCVRVSYEAGYHVDLPVYRQVFEKDIWGAEQAHHELAAAQWKRSDAREVTEWFDKENREQSPDTESGRQLRRICRLLKKFAKSRASWRGQVAGGFMITKLVTECYKADAAREDNALYNTIEAMRDQLESSLVVEHPVTPDDTITEGDHDPKARVLKEKLSDAIRWLKVLFDPQCTRKQALAAWDKVYGTDFFSRRLKGAAREVCSAPAIINASILGDQLDSVSPQAVNKQGSGTYA